MLGGDHTITLAALRSTINHWGVVNVIHFDSHIDTWDPHAVAGGVTEYAAVNHGTFLHIAHEEGLISNHSSIHAGIRAPLGTQSRDLDNDSQCGFEIVTARDIDELGAKGVIKKLKDRVGEGNVYITVDIDVLDPVRVFFPFFFVLFLAVIASCASMCKADRSCLLPRHSLLPLAQLSQAVGRRGSC